MAKRLADLARLVENEHNGPIARAVFSHIPELEYACLYARVLQHDDDADPRFPDGEPDVAQGYSRWAEYRNRREARAVKQGVYKPLDTATRFRVTQSHSFGSMSTRRLMEIVNEKEAKAAEYKNCDAYWLLIIVDPLDAAQEQEIGIDGLTVTSAEFERIILYKPYFEQILEMTPR